MNTKPTLDQLKDILGRRVKFNPTRDGSDAAIGTVIGVYMDHPCQTTELKIFSDKVPGKNGYTYRKYDEVKTLEVIRAYAYQNHHTQEFIWRTRDDLSDYVRVPALDMEKEVI